LVENEAEKKHQKELVRKLLSLLDERCRQILTLIFIKGYATEAVASELDLPSEGAVRKGQYDCLKKMRKMM
jgi:RNA polymerase sigma factor (sigma-70 family)